MTSLAIDNPKTDGNRFVPRRHLNKIRWLVLSAIFTLLVLLPFLHLYQTWAEAHAFDLLSPGEKIIYNSMHGLATTFTSTPISDTDFIKGTTWSGTLFGLKLSDPLAAVAHLAATFSTYWPLLMAVLIPVFLTVTLGRFYCGWICPATFLYELNDNLGTWLHKTGLPVGACRFDFRLKYLVLIMGVFASAFAGTALFANLYPPAIVGRELYYGIAMGGFGAGSLFFLATLGLDLLVARRGFCRYLCPGGALYSLLGRFRLLRIKREADQCNDCAKCNSVCQFGLDPMHDDFGQECNNCTACMAACPTDTLKFTLKTHDVAFQGPGHLGQRYKKNTSPEHVS